MADWMLTIPYQYYYACCPCLVGMDMCEHIGGGRCKGCIASCCCAPCFQCYMGKKIADMSGIDETWTSAVLKTICCCTSPCYGGTVALEYLKQVKDKPNYVSNKQWVMSIREQYYDICCPCLVGRDMFKHLNIDPSCLGCLARCFLPPCFLCCVGPKIAQKGGIQESVGMAILKVLCPCTEPCYGATVYAEYLYQKNKSGDGPKQQEMK